MDKIKINSEPKHINDIIKSIFLDDFLITDYNKVVIKSTTNCTIIKIIEIDELKLFMVDYKNQQFTLLEYIIFNENIDNMLFNVFNDKKLNIDDNDIVNVTDPLLTYIGNTINKK